MSRAALIFGIADYVKQPKLPCCLKDADAVLELAKAASRFDVIDSTKDGSADAIRHRIREILQAEKSWEEVLFYFSGHGYGSDGEFYFCAQDFDASRPNATGISNSELHEILRSYNPKLVVKIVDACNSGSLLIKADTDFMPVPKGSFESIIQIASCLDTQFSLTGDPLSAFTNKFCMAAVGCESQPIYYTDIINHLRDEYLGNNYQTPHFVQQGTGRAIFAEDSSTLAPFKAYLWKLLAIDVELSEPKQLIIAGEQSMLDRLSKIEERMPSPEQVNNFIRGLFDGICLEFSGAEFRDIFDSSVKRHADFTEYTAKAFMTSVFVNNKRPDKFVSAELKEKRRNKFSVLAGFATTMMMDDDEAITTRYDLRLNISIDEAQIVLTLTPKYAILQQLVLVISCAPSLTLCYVFEVLTQHARTDWTSFDVEGTELVRRWYKQSWTSDNKSLITKIVAELRARVEAHIEAAAGDNVKTD